MNCGSSSLKYSFYDTEDPLHHAQGVVERIGLDGTRLEHKGASGDLKHELPTGNFGDAFKAVISALTTKKTGVMAGAGEGATCNGAAIQVSQGHGFEGARLLGPKRFQGRLADIHPAVVALPRIGSLALRLARVAHGDAEIAMVGGSSHDWDLAAADLLVHEAGGALTDMDGKRLVYNRPDPVHGALVAAGRTRHAPLLARLRGRSAATA